MADKEVNIELSKKVFNPVYLPYLESTTRNEIYYGGAGSGKSRFVAQKKVYWHLKEAGRRTLIVRKVGRTLRHSAYQEVCTVIRDWGLEGSVFKINKSDMEIRRIDNRTQFIFAGLDDVEKLKSISGITDIWIEEATEITEDDYKQLNLRLRGGSLWKQIDLSFNPVSALSWLKTFFFDNPRQNVSILKTTYRDNIFLDREYREEIEALKDQDHVFYKIYGLGEWGVLGNLVFTNYVVEEFNREDFSGSQLRHGIDWGFNDPSVVVRTAIKDDEIYILKSLHVKGLTNTELMLEAEREGFQKHHKYIADCSEPARIEEWKNNGWRIAPAEKGKGSIKFGIDFLRRRKIHVHPDCSEWIAEAQSYSYGEDRKTGLPTEEPVDFNNHEMDATRYSFEDDAYRRKGIISAGFEFPEEQSERLSVKMGLV